MSELTVTVHFDQPDMDTKLMEQFIANALEPHATYIERVYFHTGNERVRNARTGRWVTADEAKEHPNRTVTERD